MGAVARSAVATLDGRKVQLMVDAKWRRAVDEANARLSPEQRTERSTRDATQTRSLDAEPRCAAGALRV